MPALSGLLELKLVRKSRERYSQPPRTVSTISVIRTTRPTIVHRRKSNFMNLFKNNLPPKDLATLFLSASCILIFLPESFCDPLCCKIHDQCEKEQCHTYCIETVIKVCTECSIT